MQCSAHAVLAKLVQQRLARMRIVGAWASQFQPIELAGEVTLWRGVPALPAALPVLPEVAPNVDSALLQCRRCMWWAGEGSRQGPNGCGPAGKGRCGRTQTSSAGMVHGTMPPSSLTTCPARRSAAGRPRTRTAPPAGSEEKQ